MAYVVVIVALALGLVVVLVQPFVTRSRRRRRRADRDERHKRVAREWGFAQSMFGPRPKRLTYKRRRVDSADD